MIELNGITETAHYIFHYQTGSYAERNIKRISETQEQCWQRICKELGTTPTFKIQYFLFNTPEEVGEMYGDNEPCNGFTSPPDTIYAVYNNTVKGIDPHEDAVLISYTSNRQFNSHREKIFYRPSVFLH